MADDEDRAALLSALVTEHFVLQSVSGATISESGTRAAIYLSALSSGLVSIGFASRSPTTFSLLVATVLPTVLMLGFFTVVRLVDTTIENMVALQRIEIIRGYYAQISRDAARYFPPSRGVIYGPRSIFFTLASMIAVVNAVLAGATTALLTALILDVASLAAASAGALSGTAVLAGSLLYERRRIRRAFTP